MPMKAEDLLLLLDELDELSVLVHASVSPLGVFALLFLSIPVAIGMATSSFTLATVAAVGGLTLIALAAALGEIVVARVNRRS